MTQPIQEPTINRGLARSTWNENQLYRRPQPAGGADLAWARISRGFDAANQAVVNNTIVTMIPNHNYNMGAGDSGEPYFVTNGNGIEILQQGVFAVSIEVIWVEAQTFTGWLGISDAAAGAQHVFPLTIDATNSISEAATLVHNYEGTGIILTLVVFQASGGTRNIDAAFLQVTRLGNWSGVDFQTMDPAQ